MGIKTRRSGLIGVLALGLLAAPGLKPYLLFISPDYRAQFSHNAAVMRSEVARIAAIPGAVLCTIDSVCRAAGKPFTYDVFFVGKKSATGRLTASDWNTRVSAQGIRYEAIDPPLPCAPYSGSCPTDARHR